MLQKNFPTGGYGSEIAEYAGRKVYENQMLAAENAYGKPEVATPQALEKDKEECILYIMMDPR